MHKFKEHWQIKQNWQLIFPLMGILGLVYSSFRLVKIFTKEENFYLTVSLTLVLTYLLRKFCLFIFKKLENKWVVTLRFRVIPPCIDLKTDAKRVSFGYIARTLKRPKNSQILCRQGALASLFLLITSFTALRRATTQLLNNYF